MSGNNYERALVWGCLASQFVAIVLAMGGYDAPAIGFGNGYSGPFVAGVYILWVLAIYWALDIRSGLSTPVYRRQALGLSLVAIGWLGFNAYNVVPATGVAGTFLGGIGFLILLYAVLATLYWTDASIMAAIRSDPLVRNTLHWRETRVFLWVLFIALLGLLIFGNAVPFFTFVYGPIGDVLVILFLVLTGIAFATSVFRSRDRTLRRHLKWFGFGITMLFISFLSIGAIGQLLNVSFVNASLGGQILAYAGFSYGVYRSAKSLAPMETLTTANTNVGVA